MLEVKDLTVRFRTEDQDVLAISSLSFALEAGETLAMVGESGSGKSVTALALTRLLPSPPARYVGGEILLEGQNVLTMNPSVLRRVRGGKIAYVFQDPSTSLNPVFSIRHQLAEMIDLHRPDVSKN